MTPSLPGTLPTTDPLIQSSQQGEGMEGTVSIPREEAPTTAKNGSSSPPWLVPVLLGILLVAGIAAYYASARKRR